MFGFGKKKEVKKDVEWQRLESLEQLEQLKANSFNKPVVFFKHSTSCSISATAINRFERNYQTSIEEDADLFYLDLLRFRPISNKIAEMFNVEHESPQLLLIKDGECVYSKSHYDIDFMELEEALKSN